MRKEYMENEEIMDVNDEMNEEPDKKDSEKKGKGKKAVIAAALIALAAISGCSGLSAYYSAKSASRMEAAVSEYLENADSDLFAKVQLALEQYGEEGKSLHLLTLLGEDGKQELVDAILNDMGKTKLSVTQKEQLKEVLKEMFSEKDGITISGKAIFTDGSREYLTKLISEEVAKTLVNYSGDSSDVKELMEKYKSLESALDKALSSQAKNTKVSYTLTDTDKDNIKKAVISSLGNLKGEKGDKGDKGATGATGAKGEEGTTGAKGEKGDKGEPGAAGADGQNGTNGLNGSDGRDGRDGRDGEDGYTPVKGADYFTDAEVEQFVSTIETNVKDYLDSHELKEIEKMTESIKGDVLNIFNESADNLQKELDKNNELLNAVIEAVGTEATDTNSNVFSTSKIYKEGDIVVRGGKIYICKMDFSEAGEWDETQWEETDLVTVNNYYNSKLDEMQSSNEDKWKDYSNNTDDKLSDMDSKTDGKINEAKKDADDKISALDKNTSDKLTAQEKDTDSKLSALEERVTEKITELGTSFEEKVTEVYTEVTGNLSALESRVQGLEESRVTYELIDNGDGTHTLKITDPSSK